MSRPPLAVIAPHWTQFEGVSLTSTMPSADGSPSSYTAAGHIATQACATSIGTRSRMRMWFGWSSRLRFPETKTLDSLSKVSEPSGSG